MNSKSEYTPPHRAIERMQTHLQRLSMGLSSDDCWIWDAATTSGGYGILSCYDKERRNSIPHYAHRVSAFIKNGTLPAGVAVCHSCDNRKCVNPDHLVVADQLYNMHDCRNKGRDRKNGMKGERHHQSKLTEEQVKSIRESTETYTALAEKYSISPSAACAAKLGKSWGHI